MVKPTKNLDYYNDTFIVGKRKPFLFSVEDKARILRYVEQFNAMHQWYLENPNALPRITGNPADTACSFADHAKDGPCLAWHSPAAEATRQAARRCLN